MTPRSRLSRFFWMCCALLLAVAPAPAPGQRYQFKSYGQANGLKNLNVDSMLQDRAGYLWLGTDNGLFRYDGTRIEEFGLKEGLANPYVLALEEDASGRLWAGTGGGLFYRQENRFQQLLVDGKSLAVEANSSLAALKDGRLLVVSRGQLFVAGSDSSGKLSIQAAATTPDFRNFSRGFASGDKISSVLQGIDGEIWAGCGSNLCQFKAGEFRRWDAAQGVPEANFRALFVSRDGTLWARSNTRVIALPRGAGAFEDRTGERPEKFANNYCVSFVEMADGKIATQAASGIALWKDASWKFVDKKEGLSPFPITAQLVDRDGHLWMGAAGHGMMRWLGYGQWESWTSQEGLDNPIVWSILRDTRGRVWVAGDGGVSVSDADRKHFTPVTASLGSTAASMQGITQDHAGILWAVSAQGVLLRIDPETQTVRRLPNVPPGEQIFADSHNRVWVATSQGLFRISGSDPGRAITVARADGAPAALSHVYRLTEDPEGTLWMSSPEGIFRMEEEQWHPVAISDARAPRVFQDLEFDKAGSLWAIGEFSQVWHMKVVGGRITQAERIPADKISSTAAYFVRADKAGKIWVGHDRGVDVLSDGEWRRYDSEDGLVWNDLDSKAFFADRDGSVWFGTSAGLSRFSGVAGAPARKRPAPSAVANYGDISLVTGAESAVWRGFPLEVRFAALAYEHEDDATFQYQLKGVDSTWVTTNQASVHYASLAPGAYTFYLRSVDPATRARSGITTIEFTIRRRWWQTPIANLLVVLVSLASLLLLGRLYIRQLVRRQQELEDQVAIRTRELKELATRDELTGLWNHRRIVELLHIETDRARRTQSMLAVVLIDLDHFKEINDEHGHLTGDAVLRVIGRRLKDSMRTYDSAGRYGGEEFLVLMANPENVLKFDPDALSTRLQALKASLTDEPILFEGKTIHITCSLGISMAFGDADSAPHEILASADKALYGAKRNGRNRIQYAPEGVVGGMPRKRVVVH